MNTEQLIEACQKSFLYIHNKPKAEATVGASETELYLQKEIPVAVWVVGTVFLLIATCRLDGKMLHVFRQEQKKTTRHTTVQLDNLIVFILQWTRCAIHCMLHASEYAEGSRS